MMEVDTYKSNEARQARAASVTTRSLVREFGDPNSGDYIDPFMDVSASVAKAMSKGVEYSVGDGAKTQAKEADKPDHSHMFPDRGGLHVPGVPRRPSGFRDWTAEKTEK